MKKILSIAAIAAGLLTTGASANDLVKEDTFNNIPLEATAGVLVGKKDGDASVRGIVNVEYFGVLPVVPGVELRGGDNIVNGKLYGKAFFTRDTYLSVGVGFERFNKVGKSTVEPIIQAGTGDITGYNTVNVDDIKVSQVYGSAELATYWSKLNWTKTSVKVDLGQEAANITLGVSAPLPKLNGWTFNAEANSRLLKHNADNKYDGVVYGVLAGFSYKF